MTQQNKFIEHFVAGTTAHYTAIICGVNRNATTLYFDHLREIMSRKMEEDSQEIFAGEIEVDESYFGDIRIR